MKDSMIITTKWNNWRNASIAQTNIVDNAKEGLYFFSANAYGLKGKLPGGKHSWASIKHIGGWITLEISDLETLEVQQATCLVKKYTDKTRRQVVVSDRHPGTLWFGNTPEVVHYTQNTLDFEYNTMLFPYILDDIKLRKNNCNTYLSYLMWASNSKKHLNYIGFKSYEFWDKFYNV